MKRFLLLSLVSLPACGPADDAPDFRGATFQPVFCGRATCNIGYDMVVGGETQLAIEPLSFGTIDFDHATLVSDSPEVLDVAAYLPASGAARAQVVAGEPGVATLELLDADGEPIDHVEIEVRRADRLLFVVSPVGPDTVTIGHVDGLGPKFTVETGTLVEVAVSPYAGDDELMGVVEHTLAIDEPSSEPGDQLQPFDSEAIAVGRFMARVTAGDHDLSIEALGTGGSGRLRLSGI